MTLHERVLDPWVYPLPAPLDGLHHLEDMQFNPWVYGTPPRARPQSHIKASAQKPRGASCMHRLMPCLRRPLRADRLREGLFPLRGPVRPDRRLSRFWTLLRDLTGRPLTGRLLTGPLREGPGSLTGPSQRRTTKRLTGRQGVTGSPEGPFPLTGALTGRPPYGKPFGEERSLREGRVLTGRVGVLYGAGRRRRLDPYGKPLTGRNGPYGKGRSLRGWVPS